MSDKQAIKHCHSVLSACTYLNMSSDQIITIAYALILSRIMYALPAWGGFLSAALIGKINAFLSAWNALGI